MRISKDKFIKDLKSIILKEDYHMELYKNGTYVGVLYFGVEAYRITKADIISDIEIEKRENEYDYEKDDGSTNSYLSIWINHPCGYCYYEFNSWKIRSL